MKRVFSFILAMIMMVGLLPSAAFAATACSHESDHEILRANSGYMYKGYVDEYFGIVNWGYMIFEGGSDENCTTPALAVWRCEECGFTVREIVPIAPALGHDYGEWTTEKEAGCTEVGIQTARCSRCGELTRRTIDALGHNYSTEVTKKEAACTEEGTKEQTCSRCGDKKTAPIPALGHNYGAEIIKKEATCAEEGTKEQSCTRCDDKKTDSIPAEGHKFGEWEVSRASVDDEDAEETRSCSKCDEKENRSVPAFQIKEGDRGLEVYVLQVLLTDYGTYTGEINGVFGADLTAAVTNWQQSHGLKVTGIAYGGTFGTLVDTLVQDCETGNMKAALRTWETVDLQANCWKTVSVISNEDGTHDAEYTILGVRFTKSDLGEVSFASFAGIDPVSVQNEVCLVGNEEHICSVCGYQPSMTSSDYFAAVDFSSFSLCFVPPTGLMPAVTGVAYSPYSWTVVWNAFDGADSYMVELYREGEEECFSYSVVDTPYTDIAPALELGGMGEYKVWITAMQGDTYISEPGGIGFYYAPRLGSILEMSMENMIVSWVPATDLPASCCYSVNIYSAQDPAYPLFNMSTTDTSLELLDVIKGIKNNQINSDSPGFYVSVFAYDRKNIYKDGETYMGGEFTYEEPTYYRLLANCNVRADAGTSYERIGGLNKGAIIACFGQKDGFLKINYGNQVGWVMATLCELTGAKYYSVGFHPDTDDIPETVGQYVWNTGYNGRLNKAVFDNLIENWEVLRPGYRIAKFADSHGTEMTYKTVFEGNTSVFAVWEEDPNYITIEMYSYDGEFYGSVPAKKGNLFWDYLPHVIGDLVVSGWRTDQGLDIKADGRIKEGGNMKVIKVYALKTSDEWYEVVRDTALRLNKNMNSDIIAILRGGEKVKLLDYEDYLQEPVFFVETKDGTQGYISLDDLNWKNKPRYVTLDANGGWCGVAQLVVSKGKLTLSDLPIPERDGYIFAGWEDMGDALVLQDNTTWEFRDGLLPSTAGVEVSVVKDTTLRAKWVKSDVNSVRKAVAYYSSGLILYYDSSRYSLPHNIDFQDAIYKYTFVDVIGEAIEAGGDQWYHVITGSGAEGYLPAWQVYLDYELVILKQGEYEAYSNYRAYNSSTTLTIEEEKMTFVKLGERNSRIWIFGNFNGDKYDSWWIDDSAVWGTRFHVNFNPNGGQLDGEAVGTVIKGQTLPTKKWPTASLKGAEFVGWYTDPIGGQRIDKNYVFDSSTTLYAHYTGGENDLYTPRRDMDVHSYVSKRLDEYDDHVTFGTVIEGRVGYVDLHTTAIIAQYLGGEHYFNTGEMNVLHRMTVEKSDTIREKAKTNSKTIEKIPAGTVVLVLREVDGWYEVVSPAYSNGSGFIKISGNTFTDS